MQSVSQERIGLDNRTCCHTEMEVADHTCYHTQSQYTDTGPTSPSRVTTGELIVGHLYEPTVESGDRSPGAGIARWYYVGLAVLLNAVSRVRYSYGENFSCRGDFFSLGVNTGSDSISLKLFWMRV